ncbi:tetraspanin-7-like [Palaemon carinicauda]|uniref:tetraspanin-7-like n=1 Tax=Palaemon carinicauda TaxID=392227 RepID=UPI0035B67B1C
MGKRLQTRAAVACMKTLLMTFNVIFCICGLIVLATGAVVKLELSKYLQVSAEFSATAPYVLMATGGLMFLLAVLACCCTAKGQPVLLYIYAAFLLVIFVILVGEGVSTWAFRKSLMNDFLEGLTTAFRDYEKSPTMARAVDNLQSRLSCCGIQNASDWVSMPYGFNNDPPFPPSCCKESQDGLCLAMHSQGCYPTVISLVEAGIGAFLIMALTFTCLMVVGVLLACCLARNINRAKYEQV